jgi:hypothetical protein
MMRPSLPDPEPMTRVTRSPARLHGVFLLSGVLALGGCASAGGAHGGSPQVATAVALCEVVRSPATYANRLIRLESVAKPPDHASLRLESDDCDGSIALDLSEADRGDRSVIDSAVWRDFPDADGGAAVIVEGVLEWNRGERPSRILHVSRILEVEPLEPGAGHGRRVVGG